MTAFLHTSYPGSKQLPAFPTTGCFISLPYPAQVASLDMSGERKLGNDSESLQIHFASPSRDMEFGEPAKITPHRPPASAPTVVNCQLGLGEKKELLT